jgi:hypothetical protein
MNSELLTPSEREIAAQLEKAPINITAEDLIICRASCRTLLEALSNERGKSSSLGSATVSYAEDILRLRAELAETRLNLDASDKVLAAYAETSEERFDEIQKLKAELAAYPLTK